MPDSPQERDRPGQISLLGTASTMGLHMVSGPVVGGGLGWLVDHWLGSWPVGSGIGLLLGMAAGFRNVWIDARYLARVNAEADAEAREREAQTARPKSVQKPRRSLVPGSASLREQERSAEAAEEDALREDEDLAALLASLQAGTAAPAESRAAGAKDGGQDVRS